MPTPIKQTIIVDGARGLPPAIAGAKGSAAPAEPTLRRATGGGGREPLRPCRKQRRPPMPDNQNAPQKPAFDKARAERDLSWIGARLREPSTYAGLAAVLAVVHLSTDARLMHRPTLIATRSRPATRAAYSVAPPLTPPFLHSAARETAAAPGAAVAAAGLSLLFGRLLRRH